VVGKVSFSRVICDRREEVATAATISRTTGGRGKSPLATVCTRKMLYFFSSEDGIKINLLNSNV